MRYAALQYTGFRIGVLLVSSIPLPYAKIENTYDTVASIIPYRTINGSVCALKKRLVSIFIPVPFPGIRIGLRNS